MSGLPQLLSAIFLAASVTLHPATAGLLAVTAGALLIELECLLPGRVVFGAGGLLLALLGVHRLSLLPLNATALLLCGLGVVLLFLSLLPPLRWIAGTAGTGLLATGAAMLEYMPSRPIVSLCGLVLGLGLSGCSALLLQVAVRARRNKRLAPDPQDGALGWRIHVPE